jgi:hypothetical protein
MWSWQSARCSWVLALSSSWWRHCCSTMTGRQAPRPREHNTLCSAGVFVAMLHDFSPTGLHAVSMG